MQLVVRDLIFTFVDTLINLIVVLAGDVVMVTDSDQVNPFCYLTGFIHVVLVVQSFSLICALQFHQVRLVTSNK